MKKYILAFVFAISGVIANAQDDPTKKAEKIQALKIAFITQKLELTAEEAQKFWPVYGNYEREINQLLINNRNGGDVVDADERLLNIRKKYKPEFIKVVGQPKMNRLFTAEREFRGVLMKHIRNRPQHENRGKKR